MRDRLEHLHKAHTDSEGFTDVELTQFPAQDHTDPELDAVLEEAKQIRIEVQQIQNDIRELQDAQFRTLNRTSFTDSERDANAIAANIKHRGETVLTKLHILNGVREDMERQRGVTDPTTRIARTQYQYLSCALQGAMSLYNEAELSHKDACKCQIQRQMEIVGADVCEQDMEEMMESGELKMFQVQGVTVQSALIQIETRHKELVDLEKRIKEIQELFLDVAILTQEQGEVVENVQRYVQGTAVVVEEGVSKLERAALTDKNNPLKKLFCGCFPCYHSKPIQ